MCCPHHRKSMSCVVSGFLGLSVYYLMPVLQRSLCNKGKKLYSAEFLSARGMFCLELPWHGFLGLKKKMRPHLMEPHWEETNLSEKMEGLSVAPAGDQGSGAGEMVGSSLFVMWYLMRAPHGLPSSAKLTTSYHAWNEKFFFFNVFIWLQHARPSLYHVGSFVVACELSRRGAWAL